MSRVSKKVSHDQYVALTEFFPDSDSEKSVSYTLRTGSEGFDDEKWNEFEESRSNPDVGYPVVPGLFCIG